MRKFFTFLLLALAFAFPAFAADTFRFEDYKEKTAFTEAVAKFFPVGSSYQDFKKTVIRAGASSGQNVENEPSNTHLFTKTERPGVATTFITAWSITVTVENDRIAAISPTVTISVRKDEVQ
jgi:hypothetical protein